MASRLPPLLDPPPLRYMRSHPQLPNDTWYFIAAVTLTILNRPGEIPKQTKLKAKLHVLQRTREALLKTSAVAGAPKVINACVALKQATPSSLHECDQGKSTTGRALDGAKTSSQILARGQEFFDRVYGKVSGRVTRMMNESGTEDLDLIAKLMYGHILSNTSILNQAETSYVLIAALIPQDAGNSVEAEARMLRKQVNPQLKGHLKGALNGGASLEQVKAVRDVVIKICESVGMKHLDGNIGWGWQSEVADL